MDSPPVQLDVYRTAIPMRSFEHAAARREVAEAVVVRLTLADGRCGWGETLPRHYVTGESLEGVVEDITGVLWPELCRDPSTPLTRSIDGRCLNAAACALDLARLDAGGGFAGVTGGIEARVSGVLGSADPARTGRRLRLMQWFGLRDFKLKLGFGDAIDAENLRVVCRRIGNGLRAGRCTLRVDVNGGWDADSAPARVAELRQCGVCAVEQPVFCTAERLVQLAGRCELPLIADESLLTRQDAVSLLAAPSRVMWNLRISKNGGLAPTADLARLAKESGVAWVAGCMVGESSILSAAQRRLLQAGLGPRFVEGNYGRLLLAGDLTRRSLRFGYAGRLRPLSGAGLGVNVAAKKLARYGKLVATLKRP